MGMTPPMGRAPMGSPMGLYNNYGSGGAGSHNYPGRKKREAQYNNFGSGGAGSYNFGMPMGGMSGPPMGGMSSPPMGGMAGMPSPPIFAPTLGGMNYNNFGQGGAGSHNLGKREAEPQC